MVIPLVLLAAVIALNVAGFAVTSTRRQAEQVPGLAVIRPPEDVAAIALLGDTVYAGGQQGLFVVDLDREEARVETLGGLLESVHVRALLAEDGRLWIGHDDGLVRLGPAGPVEIGTADGLPGNAVRALMRDRDGRVWVGTTSGVAVLEGDRVVSVLREQDGLVANVVNVIAEDGAGRVWLGSYDAADGGITVLDSSGEVIATFTTDEGLPHPSVTCILPEPDGSIWVGMGFHDRGGLARFEAPRGADVVLAATYLHEDGLAGPKVRSLYRSAGGVLWVGSERDGIALWPAGEPPAAGRILTARAGLADDEVKCVAERGDGGLLLGTRNGITIVEDIARLESELVNRGD